MRITADTNLLVRMATRDDERQARAAVQAVSTASQVMIPLPCVVEFVWVLESVYGFTRGEIEAALRILVRMRNVVTDVTAIETGLRVHASGGDFADGAIAAAGAAMGAETFMSFDRKAVSQIKAAGLAAELVTEQS